MRAGTFTVVLLLASLGVSSARGDPPAEPPAVPPADTAPSGAAPAEAAPADAPPAAPAPDALAMLERLHEDVNAYREPPPRTRTDTALYDAWKAILERRAGPMLARLQRLVDSKYWVHGPDGRVMLAPEYWPMFIREMSALYVALAGAYEQYGDVRVKFYARGPERPPTLALPHSLLHLQTLESDLIAQSSNGYPIWANDVAAYWALMHQVEAEWLRRRIAYEEWQRREAERIAVIEEAQAAIGEGLAMQRNALFMQMIAVRTLVATLQAQEEERLHDLAAQIRDEKARKEATDALQGMRRGRFAAARHASSASSDYGSLLRREWLGPHMQWTPRIQRAAAAPPPEKEPAAQE
jgi:hypothetical protein